jgi:2-methylcitrate dehydratase PrpD
VAFSFEAGGTIDASAHLAAMVAEADPGHLPASALDAARLDLLDTIGCALGAVRSEGVPEVIAMVCEQGGRNESLVWGTNQRVPRQEAAFANATSCHAIEYDDIHPGVCHAGTSIVPAVLAEGEARGVQDLDILLGAIVVGAEVADRTAVAVTQGPGVTGWLLTPLSGYFGAAAAAGRVAKFSSVDIQNALGLAYVQASGNGQSTLDGVLAKRMQPGFAARGGVWSVRLTEYGLTGPVNSLEGDRGYFHVYHGDRYDPSVLYAPADSWMIELAGYKPYPCCGWTHTAIEAASAIHAMQISMPDVVLVDVGVNEQAYRSTGLPLPHRYRPQKSADAQFSLPYVTAVSMIFGGVTLADFDQQAFQRSDVLDLAAKVKVHVDPDLEREESRGLSPASVEVKFADGSIVTKTVRVPKGTPDRPLAEDEIVEKFRQCCQYGGRSSAQANRLINLILKGSANAAAELYQELAG